MLFHVTATFFKMILFCIFMGSNCLFFVSINSCFAALFFIVYVYSCLSTELFLLFLELLNNYFKHILKFSLLFSSSRVNYFPECYCISSFVSPVFGIVGSQAPPWSWGSLSLPPLFVVVQLPPPAGLTLQAQEACPNAIVAGLAPWANSLSQTGPLTQKGPSLG